MISGPSGGGKSTIILNTLKEMEEKVMTFSLTLSAQTTAKQIEYPLGSLASNRSISTFQHVSAFFFIIILLNSQGEKHCKTLFELAFFKLWKILTQKHGHRFRINAR